MHKIPAALAPATYALGLLFETLVRVRGRLYETGLLSSHRLSAPVISIGNITMGGTGKTPLVIHIAQTLLKLGFHPAVLSRGYGRNHLHQSLILHPGEIVPEPALTLGDEPALVRRHLPSTWMGISKDRFTAGKRIARHQPKTVFLLDDGFQHRKLWRDLDIVIIDRSQPLRANRLFPRGTLREPLAELRRCHVVVINGVPQKETADPVEREIRNLHPEALVFGCRQRIRSIIPYSSWAEGSECGDPAGCMRSAYLVAAVGNPDRFKNDISELGIEVRGTRFFADHYRLKPKDWLACIGEARDRAAETIITTEKDAVKIVYPPDFPLLVSVQSTEMHDAAAFERVLKDSVEACQ